MKWVGVFCAALLSSGAQACTTLIAGKKATTDGSVLATHSDDGEGGADARFVRIPARTNIPAGTKRPVYWDTEDYPRHVGKDRGAEAYYPQPGQNDSVPIGYIDEVSSTYAYFEATYAIINEKSVAIGESTCSGVFGTNAVGHGGKALFSVDSLTRVALERAATSREAVQLMGDLAVQHGFYGAGSFEGSAESLMVIDPSEGFIFHILPDDTGTSAVWAAQRVPDDQVGVVANMFTIRHVDLNDTHNFLGSSNMHSIAQKHGWWDPSKGLLDFTAVYSDGEYAHKFYSGRRMWGAYHIWAPSAALPTNYTDLRYQPGLYPTFLKPDKLTDVKQLRDIHRSFYEGTPFDTHLGVAAGPFGDPNRFSVGETKVSGAWERTIGLYRTSQTHVVQARSWLPEEIGGVVWYASHAAPTSVFTPFFCGITDMAPSYSNMNPAVLDKTTAYWAHRYVANIVRINYRNMIQDVNAMQVALETASEKLVDDLSKNSTTMEEATTAFLKNAQNVVEECWTLPDTLLVKYADNWLQEASPLGYPDTWLKASGYEQGPPPPPKEPNVAVA